VAARDFEEMGSRLRARAIGLMRQLDTGGGYKEAIERELTTRLRTAATVGAAACGACGASNDHDARFCKKCGATLHVA
jgi:ribosomal protein L40E